jgi:squalene synthase HpnC
LPGVRVPDTNISATTTAPAPASVLDQAASENFPVASRLLPRAVRGDLMAMYGFARLVDDAGDEAAGDRRALLDELERDLDRVYDGEPRHELMRRLVPTVRAHGIPSDPFRRLIAANRVDQDVDRYERFDDLLAYCRLSANPVGELVLHVFGAATPERIELSDRVCSGLQVIEHVQDVAEDLRRGRIYMPLDDMRRFAVQPDDLARAPAARNVRDLIALETRRAEELLGAGLPLARTLRPRPALAVVAFVGGGLAAARAVRASGYDVASGPPRASKALRGTMILRALGRSLR